MGSLALLGGNTNSCPFFLYFYQEIPEVKKVTFWKLYSIMSNNWLKTVKNNLNKSNFLI